MMNLIISKTKEEFTIHKCLACESWCEPEHSCDPIFWWKVQQIKTEKLKSLPIVSLLKEIRDERIEKVQRFLDSQYEMYLKSSLPYEDRRRLVDLKRVAWAKKKLQELRKMPLTFQFEIGDYITIKKYGLKHFLELRV